MMRRLFVTLTLCVITLCAALIQPARAFQETPTPISPTSTEGAAAPGETAYTVQPGDNLFRISLKFNVPFSVIAAYNGIVNPNLIYVGQVLRIPGAGNVTPTPTAIPGVTATARPSPTLPLPSPTIIPGSTTTYTVRVGDTLTRIASRFGVTVQALVQLNGIVNPNTIFVGQVLKIPGAGATVTPTAPPTPVTPTPGASGTPPPTVTGSFEIGGQAFTLADSTKTAMQTARMVWIKRQVKVGVDDPATVIAQSKALGFKVLLSVLGEKTLVLTPGYFDTYADYVRTAAVSGADAIEIWNEQNIDREWPTGQISAARYVELLRVASIAIKAANPAVIVISGAPAPTGFFGGSGKGDGGWNDDVYYREMASNGAAALIDCVGVHYNEGIVAPGQTSGDPRGSYATRYFGAMINRALVSFPGKPACLTEIGYLTPEGYSALPTSFAWAQNTTIAQQATWIAQAAQKAKTEGRIRLFIVFNVDSTQYLPTDPQAGYALVRANGTCPACLTLGAIP